MITWTPIDVIGCTWEIEAPVQNSDSRDWRDGSVSCPSPPSRLEEPFGFVLIRLFELLRYHLLMHHPTPDWPNFYENLSAMQPHAFPNAGWLGHGNILSQSAVIIMLYAERHQSLLRPLSESTFEDMGHRTDCRAMHPLPYGKQQGPIAATLQCSRSCQLISP